VSRLTGSLCRPRNIVSIDAADTIDRKVLKAGFCQFHRRFEGIEIQLPVQAVPGKVSCGSTGYGLHGGSAEFRRRCGLNETAFHVTPTHKGQARRTGVAGSDPQIKRCFGPAGPPNGFDVIGLSPHMMAPLSH